jgi:multidrug efflux pump subunit AcrB
VVVTQFGAGPPELEVQVTKYIEDSVSGIDGVILPRRSATGVGDDDQFRLDASSDRALNDVKDAAPGRGPTCRATSTASRWSSVDIADPPIVTDAAISPGKTPERLSVRGRRGAAQLQGVRGVAARWSVPAASTANPGVARPDRLQAVGLTADVSKPLRGTNVDVAGPRPNPRP